MRGFESWDHLSLQGLLGIGFDVKDFAAIAKFSKRNGQTIAPCAPSASNAMHIVLALHGQAIVEHVADAWDIKATSGHICGDQKLNLPISKGHQASISQTLTQSTMQCDSRKARLLQIGGQAITFDLRACKHNGLLNAGVS